MTGKSVGSSLEEPPKPMPRKKSMRAQMAKTGEGPPTCEYGILPNGNESGFCRVVQWSLSIKDTAGTQLAVLYREVSLIQR